MMNLTLASGRRVSVHGLHITRTYARLLEGTPSEDVNWKMVADAGHYMERMWGIELAHVIAPQITQVSDAGGVYPRLPELTYHAWLTSGPMHGSDASHAVIVWFGPEEPHTGISDIVQRAVREVPWEQIAVVDGDP